MIENEVIRAILNRESCRSFTGEPLSDEVLETIVQAGTYAPNAGGRQPWLFVVVTNPSLLERLNKSMIEVWKSWGHFDDDYAAPENMPNVSAIYNAPAAIFLLELPEHTPVVSASLAAENMMIAAQSLGVGTCWVQSLAAEVFHGEEGYKLRRRISSPDYEIVGAMLLGYPAENAYRRPRKARKEDAVRFLR